MRNNEKSDISGTNVISTETGMDTVCLTYRWVRVNHELRVCIRLRWWCWFWQSRK